MRPEPRRWTVLHTEHSDGWGGQEMRIVGEARGVAARGHRVLIAARPQCAILPQARSAGLETFTVPMRRNLDPIAIGSLASLIRRQGVDIVNTHSSIDAWVGGAAARLAGVKLLRTRHVSKRIRDHLLNVVHRWPEVTLTTGEVLRRQFIADTGVGSERVVSVPTGIDVDHFAPDTDGSKLRQHLGLPSSARIIATVAVLRRAKRHVLLVEAAARLRHRQNLFFVFAGDGSQRQPIEQRINELGLQERVRLLGHVDDVRWVLGGADVVAAASSGMEGVPQALMQGLAMQRPVVATSDGAVEELVLHEKTGLIVPPEQPEAMANAIERLLDDAGFGQRLAAYGRQHVIAHYSLAAMIEAVIAVYARLMEKS